MPHVTVFIANITPVPAGAGRYAQGFLVPTFFSYCLFLSKTATISAVFKRSFAMSNRKQSETDVGQSAYKEAAARETLMQTLSKTSAQNSGIRIVNPAPEYYDAFVKACGQMRAYVNDPSIPDDIGKKESKGFIFARDEFANLTKADFETKVVDNYRKKEEKDAEKPEYFRFIMDGNTIVGSVNARAMKMDDFDIKNGLEPYREWSHISEKGAKITTSTLILPEHRGKGIIGQAEKLFFDELKSKGIDEITSTVLSENDGSNRAQKKLIEKFGGKSYQIHGDPDGKGVRHYNRYVIRTDTTGKDKTKYNEQTAAKQPLMRTLSDIAAKRQMQTTVLQTQALGKNVGR